MKSKKISKEESFNKLETPVSTFLPFISIPGSASQNITIKLHSLCNCTLCSGFLENLVPNRPGRLGPWSMLWNILLHILGMCCSVLQNMFHIVEKQIPGVLIKVEWAVSYWSAIVRIHFECLMPLHCPNVTDFTLHYIDKMFYVTFFQHFLH